MDHIEEVNQSLVELWDAATALHDLIEKASSTLPVENAKPGERHRKGRE
jgi:hypothetical protein